jgi:hypothetical protein
LLTGRSTGPSSMAAVSSQVRSAVTGFGAAGGTLVLLDKIIKRM